MLEPTSRRWIGLILRGLGSLLAAGLLSSPLALVYGISHASVIDYLGPQRSEFATNFTGETRLDLGPLGDAYLPVSYGPIGVTVTVGGVEGANAHNAYLSQQTLTSYTMLYTDPGQTIEGVRDRLVEELIAVSVRAELVLVALMIGWRLRRHYLNPSLVRASRSPRSWIAYALVVIICLGSAATPVRPATQLTRYPVTIADGTRFAGMTVDSRLLADLLDTGIKGVRLLARRQLAAISSYIGTASDHFLAQSSELAEPEPGESRIVGFADLHCSIAMTEVIRRVVAYTEPIQVFSSGDDTMNGTAAERSCIVKEKAIAADRPFTDATGNHDSNVTDDQLRKVGARVLDGAVIKVGKINYLGDDDPEYNIPFSIDRVQERPETEDQLGRRLLKAAAGRDVDLLLVHQPRAAAPIVTAPNPPAKLIAWGHMHVQAGPTVIPHQDGSWTVALQMGTAGGIAQPTFTSFSTPFTPPRKSADVYVYFRDDATGLVTGVQPIHFLPDGTCVIDKRITTGDVRSLPAETRRRLGGDAGGTSDDTTPGASGSATPTGAASPEPASGSASGSDQTAAPSPLPSATTPGTDGDPAGG